MPRFCLGRFRAKIQNYQPITNIPKGTQVVPFITGMTPIFRAAPKDHRLTEHCTSFTIPMTSTGKGPFKISAWITIFKTMIFRLSGPLSFTKTQTLNKPLIIKSLLITKKIFITTIIPMTPEIRSFTLFRKMSPRSMRIALN